MWVNEALFLLGVILCGELQEGEAGWCQKAVQEQQAQKWPIGSSTAQRSAARSPSASPLHTSHSTVAGASHPLLAMFQARLHQYALFRVLYDCTRTSAPRTSTFKRTISVFAHQYSLFPAPNTSVRIPVRHVLVLPSIL